jgi:transcriptional regulator with XRE-family HTH domain
MYPFRECRERAGLSQKAAALSLHVKPPSVSDWETGKTKPTIENLLNMADLYKTNLDVLLGRETGDRTAPPRGLDDQALIAAYHSSDPDIQKAIRKLLDLPESEKKDSERTAI